MTHGNRTELQDGQGVGYDFNTKILDHFNSKNSPHLGHNFLQIPLLKYHLKIPRLI